MDKSFIYSGLRPVASWLRRKPTLAKFALMSIPDVPWRVRVDEIGTMEIRLRRHRSFWLRHPLSHEGFMFGALQKLIQPHAIVYDVGANIGLYARFILARFGAGQVVAFEPMSENRVLLERNIRHGDVQNAVTILPFALSDTDGAENLQVDDIMSGSATLDRITDGLASFGRRSYDLPPRVERVAVARLDTLVMEQARIPPPDVIKIDIEGAEAIMLRGATQTLAKHKPTLVMEMHDLDVTREVIDILTTCGYLCYGYLIRGGERKYQRVTVNDVPDDYVYHLHHIVAATAAEPIAQAIEDYVASGLSG